MTLEEGIFMDLRIVALKANYDMRGQREKVVEDKMAEWRNKETVAIWRENERLN